MNGVIFHWRRRSENYCWLDIVERVINDDNRAFSRIRWLLYWAPHRIRARLIIRTSRQFPQTGEYKPPRFFSD